MKIRDRELRTSEVQKERSRAGLPQLETIVFQGEKHPYLFWFSWIAFVILLALIIYIVVSFINVNGDDSFSKIINILKTEQFLNAVLIGFKCRHRSDLSRR